MTTTAHEAASNLDALQQLPEQDARPDGDDPGCGTTGVTQAPPGPHTELDRLPEPEQDERSEPTEQAS